MIKTKLITTLRGVFAVGLMLLSIQADAQWNTTDWKFSDPRQFGFTTFDAQYINNNIGVAVGDQGGIARTTDGGVNWTYGAFTFVNSSGTTTKQAFNDVHFVSTTHVYAVGNGGLMAKSTDGGTTWAYVNNPFFGQQKSIFACWFTSNDVGYIGGEWLSTDSITRLYKTVNGGTTWDSISVNITGRSRVGYINNPNIAPIIRDVTAKGKVINRIIFTSPTLGYVSGTSASGGGNFFPSMPSVNSPTAATNPCGLTGTTTSTSAGDGALFWKFDNGQLIDYSFSKERLGYSGVNTTTIVCNTTYGQIQPQTNNYRAMNVYNDSIVVLMSFNNNIVIRVRTGRNDSTTNLATGLREPGRYEILSFPFPPNSGTPIPNPNNNLFSNPYHLTKGPDNRIYAPVGSSSFAPVNRTYVSSDTGRNWVEIAQMPQGRNYSTFRHFILNFLPNGKAIANGQSGVVADSFPGPWNSNYIAFNPSVSTEEIDFADCNNGVTVGGSTMSVTENGARTWLPKNRADFASSFTSMTGVSYPFVNKMYISANNGTVYKSVDKGTTLDPSYQNTNFQMMDVQAIGQDTVYALGNSQFSVPVASRTTTIFRSVNNGATWTPFNIETAIVAPSTAPPRLNKISFGTNAIGYAVGGTNSIYKTTNAGATWSRISPFPAINQAPTGFATASVNYTDVFALDANTVFACGNMFTSVNNRRIYKSTDGGSTWNDISSNIASLIPVGNLNAILFHDADNGYVVLPGGAMIRTTNGGTSWTSHLAPSGILTEGLGFAPRVAPAGSTMANRRLFVIGFAGPGSGGHILEFGNPAQTTVSSTEATTQASCTNTTGGSITVTATGGLAPYMYSINGGATQLSNTFTGLAQGTYTLRVMSQACDTVLKNIVIGFNNNLIVNKSNDTIVCAGAPVPLLASGNAATYTWTPSTGLSATNIANPTAIVNAPISYTVTGTLNGCTLSQIINIGIRANPAVNAGPDFTIVDGDDVTLQGSGQANVINIAWTPTSSILSGATTFTPIAKPTTTTTYTLTVRDNNSCTSTDQAVVTVIPYCVKIMDAFTPNGDGINDRWLVTTGAACTKQIIVNVYNRYGALMYNNENYTNNWDGTYKGKPVADGTYYYRITMRLINGKTVIQQGDVTILR